MKDEGILFNSCSNKLLVNNFLLATGTRLGGVKSEISIIKQVFSINSFYVGKNRIVPAYS